MQAETTFVSVHEVRAEAAGVVALIGSGGRITGVAVRVNGACVGGHGNVGICAGAVLASPGGAAFAAAGCGDRGGAGRRISGRVAVPLGTGHRAEQNRGESQRGETPRGGSTDSLGCFHRMTIPFGQGRDPLPYFYAMRSDGCPYRGHGSGCPMGHPAGDAPQGRVAADASTVGGGVKECTAATRRK